MFRGHFEHAIDAKGRTSLPSRFRDVLGSAGDALVVLTPSPFDACLHLFPMKAWEEFEAKIAALPQFEPNVIKLRRLYVSAAVECEVDKQGRVLVPPDLARHAGLGKDVAVVGVHDHVEIWSRPEWADHVSAIEGSVGDVAERAADRRG